MCVGCQEAPKEVQERMEGYGEKDQMGSTEIKYCSVGELKQADISEEPAGLDNMTLLETVDCSNMESLAILIWRMRIRLRITWMILRGDARQCDGDSGNGN